VTQTIPGGGLIACYKQGKIAYPGDIHKYVVCEYISEGPAAGWWIHIMGCAPGTKWKENVKGDDGICVDDIY